MQAERLHHRSFRMENDDDNLKNARGWRNLFGVDSSETVYGDIGRITVDHKTFLDRNANISFVALCDSLQTEILEIATGVHIKV